MKPDRPYRIALFRALQLGDMLCAVPALRALRKAFGANAEITLIGLPWSEELLLRYPNYLDRHLTFPGYPGLPEQGFSATAFDNFVRQSRAFEFDLAIQMHGNGTVTNKILTELQAKTMAGWYHPAQPKPDGCFMPLPEELSEIDRCLKLMSFLNMRDDGPELEFPISRLEQHRASLLLRQIGVTEEHSVVCIHPGARDVKRRWDKKGFIAVGRYLSNYGHTILITGTADEFRDSQDVANAIGIQAHNIAGRTSPGELAAVLNTARLLICNDTGVSHLASALKTGSIIVFSASDPLRWAPRDRKRHRPVLSSGRRIEQVTDEILLHAFKHLNFPRKKSPDFPQVEA